MTEVQDAELWIGECRWPGPTASWHSPSRMSPFAGVNVDEFQIAGILCHHQKFFGMCFQLPGADPLAALAHRYTESHLPGTGNPEFATPLDDIVRLRDQLAELGLVLDPVHYAKFAEAYLPIGAESACRYAFAKRLRLVIRFHPEHTETAASVSEIGVAETWPAVQAHLTSTWEYLAVDLDPRVAWTPERWTAVVHYPNCD